MIDESPLEDDDPLYDAYDALEGQHHVMDLLEEAIVKGEHLPGPQIAKLLSQTLDIEIPKDVRKYVIDILADEKLKKSGNRAKSVLDTLSPAKAYMRRRDLAIYRLFCKLIEKGGSKTAAYAHIAERCMAKDIERIKAGKLPNFRGKVDATGIKDNGMTPSEITIKSIISTQEKLAEERRKSAEKMFGPS